MRVSSLVGIIAVLAASVTPQVVLADQVSTQIINPSHSPAAIQRCQVDTTGNYGSPAAWINVQNRTHHELITVDVQYSFYDSDKAMFAQATMQYTPGSPVASGDIQQFSGGFWPQHSEPFNVTSYVTCRVNAATFTGQKSWHYGERWREGLVSNSSAGQEHIENIAAPRHASAAPPKLPVQVLSAWQDPAPRYETGVYIHDRITISGADQAVTVHPHDFTLHVVTSGGQTESIHGLAKSAPQYLKVNYATNQSAWTPEVAVDEDLGAHGSLDVPAHGSATTVVTFYVPRSVDTSRISDVSFL